MGTSASPHIPVLTPAEIGAQEKSAAPKNESNLGEWAIPDGPG